ncbi:MAG: nicotinamide-nucleotide adenylyltransferase [Acidilobaceae archaeon]
MSKYARLLVPGRFQPPHYGHISTIKYALKLADEVIVVVGSAQESYTLSNPLTAGERVLLLRKVLSHELGDDYYRVYIVPVMDIQMHKVWVQYLRMLLPPFDGVVSGNELVLMLFEDMGLAALKPPLYKPDVCNGSIIRDLVARGGNWWECVPKVIMNDLENIGFTLRVKRLAGVNIEASRD